jgi:hypothetical protein
VERAKAEVVVRGLIAVSFFAAISLFSEAAIAKCAYMSTGARFSAAADVLLVSVVDVQDGFVPLPYGLEKGTTVPGRLLTLRVIKSWKGPLRSGAVVRGFTQGPRIEDSYPNTQVGTQIIFFSRSGPPYEIRSCNAANPDRLHEVAEELDAITKTGGTTQPHGTGG